MWEINRGIQRKKHLKTYHREKTIVKVSHYVFPSSLLYMLTFFFTDEITMHVISCIHLVPVLTHKPWPFLNALDF
jgi:hypothetical protein